MGIISIIIKSIELVVNKNGVAWRKFVDDLNGKYKEKA